MPGVAAAIAASVTAALTPALGASWAAFIGAAAPRLLISVAVGAIQSGLARNAAGRDASGGIRIGTTQTGGTRSTSFILGTYMTAGNEVCPPMSHGAVGKTPNAYLTYVIELSDIRGMGLSRVVIDGEYATLSGTPDVNGFYPATGRFAGYAWVKFYNGTQVVADPWLLSTYGTYPSRPWTSDMIGRDQCYAILYFKFSSSVFRRSKPEVRFEVTGIPLYDPRFDTSVGGSGSQRWATPSTWVVSSNPMVQIYHICRGVAFADGSIWGGNFAAADLPLTEWFAAMNACDVATALAAGGTEAAYRSGIEVLSSDEPSAVIEELLKSCSAQLVDMGGIWKPKVGAVGLPILFITDDDVVVTKPQEYEPFPSLSDTFNGVSASYPDPTSIYESVSAPIRTNATDETADGGRRLIADLAFPAVPYRDQVQRLMESYRLDNRRFRRHGLTFGPSALLLEPTDSFSWTSTANGYAAKVFEVSSLADDVMTTLQRVGARERDSADYAWNAAADTKATSPVAGAFVTGGTHAVGTWNVTAVILTGDVPGVAIPALSMTWDGVEQEGATGIKFQIRLVSSGTVVIRGSTHDVDAGVLVVADGIAGSTAYEARSRFVNPTLDTSWSAWVGATTGTASYIPGYGVFLDTNFTLQDNLDPTKQAQFQLSGITTGTMRTFTFPDTTGTFVLNNQTTSTLGNVTAAATLNIGAGVTISGSTKAVNIGTAAASGSTTTVQIGSAVAGALGTLTINSPTVAFGATVTAINLPDVATFLVDSADTTKKLQFDAALITTGTTRTVQAPDTSGIMVVTATGNIDTVNMVNGATTQVKIQDGAVSNAKLDTMAANTVKANATAGVASPTNVALAASQLLGRGAAGDISAIVLGTNLSMSGTTLNAAGGGGGSAISGTATLTVPNNRIEWSETVTAVGVLGTHRIFLTVGNHLDSDENSAELLDIDAMSAAPGTGQITVTIGFDNPTSGPVLLNWSAF